MSLANLRGFQRKREPGNQQTWISKRYHCVELANNASHFKSEAQSKLGRALCFFRGNVYSYFKACGFTCAYRAIADEHGFQGSFPAYTTWAGWATGDYMATCDHIFISNGIKVSSVPRRFVLLGLLVMPRNYNLFFFSPRWLKYNKINNDKHCKIHCYCN